jgi:hypothetical protein
MYTDMVVMVCDENNPFGTHKACLVFIGIHDTNEVWTGASCLPHHALAALVTGPAT